jgi:hypothetical protein
MNYRYKKLCFFNVIALLWIAHLSAQEPDTLWARTYGGLGNDIAYSVCETSDGCYVAVGYTSSFGSGPQDVYVIKTASNGDTLWTKTWGGGSWDGGHYVCETSDSGYIIAAYTESFGAGGKDVYLIKIDANGVEQWTKTYGTGNQDVAYSVCETADSGYIVVGYINGPSDWVKGDLWILKTDPSGDTLWTKMYGGAGEDYGVSIRETADSGYVIAGINSSVSAGGKDVWLVKIDAQGDTVWTKVYGGSLEDVGYGVNVCSDSGYIVTGYINGTGQWTAGDLWLLKTDVSGDTMWTKIYGSAGEDFAFDAFPTADGGYIMGGETGFGAGLKDVWLIKTNAIGDTVWTKTYGGTNNDVCLALSLTADGGYILAGYTFSFGVGEADFYLIKTEPDVGSEEDGIMPYPEIKHGSTIITGPLLLPEGKKYRVFDITGRIVIVEKIQPGVYFLEIDEKIVQKVVKVR